ncbi:MAG: ABC-F family ATP-binding cassette domain-containing protein [Spirochaetaceae bacterium]|jgi:ATP-binding cassette subfamily F protein uup|nr:ABC-F family ATP-binding cassette domain-containing protein [Spirochaetaceae bacterium]
MNLISVDTISKTVSSKILFSNISFGVNEGDKLALIGVTGCGKSTLLRILSGEDDVDNGTISRNRETNFSILKQKNLFNKDESILEHILSGDSPLIQTVKTYESIVDQMSIIDNEDIHSQFDKIMIEMDRLNCWELESRVTSLLSELGINDKRSLMSTLSGGMLKKVAIVQALVSEGDLIFLDEPTNHLDIETIEWLQDYLYKSNKAIIIVTHDRYFLDTICTGILEIDNEKLFKYDGNYSCFLERKALRESIEKKEQSRLDTILRREFEWLKRGPRARTGKDKGRKNRIIDMTDQKTSEEQQSAEFSVNERRLGKKVLDLVNISKSYDNKEVIKPFSYKFRKGERIGIVGPNGSGKSTFLNLITEKIISESGSVTRGINTIFGYFDQLTEKMAPQMKVLEYLKETAEILKLNDGSAFTPAQLLERFLFPKSLHFSELANLSGGEKRRLYLIKIILSNPNFLILDEPTNDFDIQTLSLIEDFLLEYQGCLLVVSHDRYFLDRVIDFLFIFDGDGNINGFPGNYSQYREFVISEQRTEKENIKKNKSDSRVKTIKEKKASFKEKEEFFILEKDIEKLEEEKENLEVLFSSDALPEKITKAHIRYSAIDKELQIKMERWEELAEFMDL